jgi:hypothetical protein
LKFYDSEKEMTLLEQIDKKSLETAQTTFVVRRRHIEKTSLLINLFAGERAIYFLGEIAVHECFVNFS